MSCVWVPHGLWRWDPTTYFWGRPWLRVGTWDGALKEHQLGRGRKENLATESSSSELCFKTLFCQPNVFLEKVSISLLFCFSKESSSSWLLPSQTPVGQLSTADPALSGACPLSTGWRRTKSSQWSLAMGASEFCHCASLRDWASFTLLGERSLEEL